MNIVPATPEDYDALVDLYDRHGFALRRREWLDWKYVGNPDGGARSFKILQDGALAGSASLLPRLWRYGGRRFVGVQFVDGLMGREVRGKGLFREQVEFLIRAAAAGQDEPHFCFTVPSVPASVKACANAGLLPLGHFDLHTRVVDPAALGRLRGLGWLPPLARPAWRAAEAAVPALTARGVTVEEIRRFDRDLTWLFSCDQVHGDRSEAYLNWRVFANPRDTMRAFYVHEAGRLAGFVVAKEVGACLEIMELKFSAPRARYLRAFVGHVAARRLAETIDCRLLAGHPYVALLRRAGFLRRSSSETGVFYVHGHVAAGLPDDPAAWDVHVLDSDW